MLRLTRNLIKRTNGILMKRAYSDEADYKFSESDIKAIEFMFLRADLNEDKKLTRWEFNSFVEYYMGRKLDTLDRDQLFAMLDTDHDDQLHITDILKHLNNRFIVPTGITIADAFCEYDKDEDGRIELHECREALFFLGQLAGAPQITTYFCKLDGNKDNKINEQEFKILVEQYMPLLNN